MFQTERVLLLYAHPESQESVVNRVLLAPALQLKNVTVHDLYAHYPDFFIDVSYEQKLLCQHKVLVFQHPLYTYSCPALLKEWLDRVLGRNFSNVTRGKQTEGKYWRSVITAGEPENIYNHKNKNNFFISEILRPFELTASKYRMNWIAPLIIYLAQKKTLQELEEHAKSYGNWLASPIPKGNS